MIRLIRRAAKRRHIGSEQGPAYNAFAPFGARFAWRLTQGSQSLALGSTLIAASQLFHLSLTS